MSTKRCSACGQRKTVEDFYAHPKTTDGLMAICKECHKVRVRANRAENLAYYQAFDRERGQLPERKAGVLARVPMFKSSHNSSTTAWSGRNPAARSAENVLNNAIRDGKVKKPDMCKCGKQAARINGFHHDVSKPLDVEWLCDACLGAARRARNEERRQAQQEAS